jgi:hypothetical protein
MRLERFGSSAKLLQWRGIACEFGEDSQGLITAENPVRHFFSIGCIDSRYLIQPVQHNLRLNGAALSLDKSHVVNAGDLVQLEDYRVTLYPTSSSAELLGHLAARTQITSLINNTSEKDFLTLVLTIAERGRSFPIPPGVRISVGKNSAAVILVDAEGIHDEHCIMCSKIVDGMQTISVFPTGGRVTIGGNEIFGEVNVRVGDTIELPPNRTARLLIS